MFGTNTITSGLSLSKIISTLSRGLTFANQVIPIYQQAKPLVSNARKMMGILKEFSHSDSAMTPSKMPMPNKNTSIKPVKTSPNPVFFQ